MHIGIFSGEPENGFLDPGNVKGVIPAMPAEHNGIPRDSQFRPEIFLGVGKADHMGNPWGFSMGHDLGKTWRDIGKNITVKFRFPKNRVNPGFYTLREHAIVPTIFDGVKKICPLLTQNRLSLVRITVNTKRRDSRHHANDRMVFCSISPRKQKERFISQNLYVSPGIVHQGHFRTTKAEVTAMKGDFQIFVNAILRKELTPHDLANIRNSFFSTRGGFWAVSIFCGSLLAPVFQKHDSIRRREEGHR